MQIHWYQILFQIINFSILIWGLNKFLYQPIIKLLEKRNQKIQDGVKAAEESMEEKAKLDEFAKRVKLKAEKEATQIMSQARKNADQQAKDMLETAKSEAKTLVDKEFENLKEKLRDEEAKMQSRLGKLVVDTTQTIIGSALSDKEQHRLIEQELKMLKNFKLNKWSQRTVTLPKKLSRDFSNILKTMISSITWPN